ncbi:cysteine and glycine-rich protein 2 [Acaromyces ingoldii]|uniref:Cysteine and glycine-rich protein 2 n=1 Tax=Acaromyces ingoldii TaxID=215250 RepID=A0A316YDY4_9BASI|nr:cysteine and glycine-rich protein 2 [Acaromyces ingoldii]PWN87074.1 cysteine and glycine-rich protein 2 [Acaromyces ingoldii]
MPPRIGGVAPKCAKCDKSVYAAEQVIGPASKIYHKPCLACTICGRRLDSSLLVDHEGQPMCTNCYKAHLGQGKGGFSTSVPLRPAIKATLDSSYTRSPPKTAFGGKASTAPSGTPLCARCAKPVYFAEQKQAANRKWHRGCLRCDGCSSTLDSGRLEEGPAEAANGADVQCNIWCRTCYAKRFGPKGIGVAGMSLPEMQR